MQEAVVAALLMSPSRRHVLVPEGSCFPRIPLGRPAKVLDAHSLCSGVSPDNGAGMSLQAPPWGQPPLQPERGQAGFQILEAL